MRRRRSRTPPGEKSRKVATVLRDWLPQVIQVLEPFLSAKDIDAGARWQAKIADKLDTINFGIVCVTAENQLEPWLNFEAGALAKSVEQGRLVPLAIDLKTSDVKNPLGQFQAQRLNKDGIREIVKALNTASGALPPDRLERAFDLNWPTLEWT
jgi:TIR domain